MKKLKHPIEVANIYDKILKESSATGRYIGIGGRHKIHVIEAGSGPPLVYLHGGSAAAHTFLPVLEHLKGVRTIIPDRPGYGLSDSVDMGHNGSYRDMAVEVTDQILDTLRVDQVSLAGSSGGGVWAIWYALAYPKRVHRLVLPGSAPLLPGTYCPVPQRIMTTPLLGDIIDRIPTTEKMIIKFMGMMGEKETIVNYPKMIEGLTASGNDPVVSKAARQEYSAFVNLFGFKNNMKIQVQDLANLQMPTLLIWGKHDPLGGEDVARAINKAIPRSVLKLLPAGHVPYFGHPKKTAKLILDFVLSE